MRLRALGNPIGTMYEVVSLKKTTDNVVEYRLETYTAGYVAKKIGQDTATQEDVVQYADDQENNLKGQLHYTDYIPTLIENINIFAVGGEAGALGLNGLGTNIPIISNQQSSEDSGEIIIDNRGMLYLFPFYTITPPYPNTVIPMSFKRGGGAVQQQMVLPPIPSVTNPAGVKFPAMWETLLQHDQTQPQQQGTPPQVQ